MPVTTPSAKRTSSGCTPSLPAATTASRSRIWSQAFLTAPPLMSAPELAAVAEVFGTLSVRVGASRTVFIGTPSAVAATWIILVCRPWPISVPPWLISTEPSLYTCTSAPAWLNAVRLNEMPNLTGVIASPRLVSGWAALNAATSAWRRANSLRSITCDQIASSRSACRTGCPYGVAWPGA